MWSEEQIETYCDPRAYCPCCGSGPGQECDEICKQIQKEMEEDES